MSTVKELYWAAGFLEGEGWFGFQGNTFRIQTAQVEQEPLLKLQRILGGKIRFQKIANPRQSDHFRWEMYGPPAGGAMMTLFSLFSPKRQEQIRKSITAWKLLPVARKYRTHCPQGHEFTEENTSRSLNRGKPARWCRTCCRARSQSRRDRGLDTHSRRKAAGIKRYWEKQPCL